MKLPLGFILSALLVSLSFAEGTTSKRWKLFKSSTGFTVEYPDNWFPKGVSKDRLDILSSTGGAEGIIIKRGQAFISVAEERDYRNMQLSVAIDYYTRDTKVLVRRNISNPNAGPNGCRDLLEIISREPVVPPEDVRGPVPFMIDTLYFCEVKGRKYVTVLKNFDGDKSQARYQEIALRVTKSLRVH